MNHPRQNERVAYHNGRILPESEVLISFRDRGFLFGDAVFDTARTFAHKPFRLKEHVDRLFHSLDYLRIDPGLTPAETVAISEEVLARNLHLIDKEDDYWLTQRISRGPLSWIATLRGGQADGDRGMPAAAAEGAGQELPRRDRGGGAADAPHPAGFLQPAGQEPQLSQHDHRRSRGARPQSECLGGAAGPAAISPRAWAPTSSWCARASC
jgi:Branched-chain amino acid aminotransferase/4-amino-4-deoxychorismate lyase